MTTFANNATTLAKANEVLHILFSNRVNINGNLSAKNIFQPIPISITEHAVYHWGKISRLDPWDRHRHMYAEVYTANSLCPSIT